MCEPTERITWLDSRYVTCGWMARESCEDLDVVTAQTAGFVVKEDEECVVIAQNISDHQVSSIMVIPKKCIIKREANLGDNDESR